MPADQLAASSPGSQVKPLPKGLILPFASPQRNTSWLLPTSSYASAPGDEWVGGRTVHFTHKPQLTPHFPPDLVGLYPASVQLALWPPVYSIGDSPRTGWAACPHTFGEQNRLRGILSPPPSLLLGMSPTAGLQNPKLVQDSTHACPSPVLPSSSLSKRLCHRKGLTSSSQY